MAITRKPKTAGTVAVNETSNRIYVANALDRTLMIVDGATLNDPANRQVQTSFGSFQSMVVVPGPTAVILLRAPGVFGAVATLGSLEL